MKEILPILMAFVSQEMDLPIPHDPPRIEIVEQHSLVSMTGVSTVRAYHLQGTLYFNTNENFELLFGQSVIVHELVHYFQYVHFEFHRCEAEHEAVAYSVQKAWIDKWRKGWHEDWFNKRIKVTCE